MSGEFDFAAAAAIRKVVEDWVVLRDSGTVGGVRAGLARRRVDDRDLVPGAVRRVHRRLPVRVRAGSPGPAGPAGPSPGDLPAGLERDHLDGDVIEAERVVVECLAVHVDDEGVSHLGDNVPAVLRVVPSWAHCRAACGAGSMRARHLSRSRLTACPMRGARLWCVLDAAARLAARHRASVEAGTGHGRLLNTCDR